MTRALADGSRLSRRGFLLGASVAATTLLAGCGGGGDGGDGGDGGGPTVSGSEWPTIDEWLTETDIGDATSNYDGSLADLRDQDTVTVDVGASGNNGAFAFGPPGIVVSQGTTVEFSWTGQGNPHNVDANPDEQIGESDYEFRSGGPESGSGVKFTQTMDTAGVALYHCEPHLSIGMKGGIGVE